MPDISAVFIVTTHMEMKKGFFLSKKAFLICGADFNYNTTFFS